MPSWLCLFSDAMEDGEAEAYAEKGYIFVLGLDHTRFAERPDFRVIALREHIQDEAGIVDESLATWRALGEETLPEGSSIRSELSISGVSLWDVCAAELGLYHIRKIIRNRAGVDDIFRQSERPDEIVLEDSPDVGAAWLRHRAQEESIPVRRLVSARPAHSGMGDRLRPGLKAARNFLYSRWASWTRSAHTGAPVVFSLTRCTATQAVVLPSLSKSPSG